MHGVAKISLDEIDGLTVELRRRREKLLSESARLQREIIGLHAFSQSAAHSTKISTRHLSLFKLSTQCISDLRKAADAPAMSGLNVEGNSNEEHHENGVGPAQHDRTSGDQAETTAATSSEIEPNNEG
jgi:hypothetical protein